MYFGSKLLVLTLFGGSALLRCQTTNTQIDANTQIKNLWLNPLGVLPQGKINLYTYDNYPIIQTLVNSASVSGLCKVYLPPGIWYVSQGIDVPTCVELYGVGFGQGTDFAPSGPILGTVVQAMTSFTGPSGYPSNFMLRIDGSTTVGPELDTYNVDVHNITFTCAGISGCSGFYVGHANANVKVHDSVFANWTQFGEYHCGAGLGYQPWLHCGDRGSGPYYNNQLISQGGWVTSATYPMVIMSSLGDYPWSNYKINTTPGPVNGVTVQGQNLMMESITINNSTNGIVMGPTSGLCATLPNLPSGPLCLGVQVSKFEKISLTNGSGYVLVNQNAVDTTLLASLSDGVTTGILQDLVNSVNTANPYLGWYYLSDSGTQFSVENGAYIKSINITGLTTANALKVNNWQTLSGPSCPTPATAGTSCYTSFVLSPALSAVPSYVSCGIYGSGTILGSPVLGAVASSTTIVNVQIFTLSSTASSGPLTCVVYP